MLPRRARLSRAGFTALGSARRISTPHFTLSIAPAGTKGGVAVVISKKVAPRAVDRHVLKRRMYAVLRPFVHPSRALIVFPKSGARDLPFRVLQSELLSVLQTLA